jgi:phytoene dehydrogenase-like protein
MTSCDAIVIGAGTNGLAAAGRLAKAGCKVIVLEERERPGGGARTHEFAPGFKVSTIAHTLTALDPRVELGLDLARHGLSYAATGLATTALSASGQHLVMEGCFGEHLTGSISRQEQEAWAALRRRLLCFAGVIRPLKDQEPPRLRSGGWAETLKLAKLGLRARRLGRDDMREFLRMLLINVADVLNDELTDDLLKGAIAFDAVRGAHMGPRSPNTLLLLVNRLAAEAAGETAGMALPHGGMGAVAGAMSDAVNSLGVQVHAGSRVGSIVIEDDHATGVVLGDGRTIRSNIVVSAIAPRTTFLELVGSRHLDTETIRRARNIRTRGASCKLHIALRDKPDFNGASLATRLLIAPAINVVETAFDAVKYGKFSDEPVMEIIVPTAIDSGQAPEGCHAMSVVAQYAPYSLRGGWTAGRPEFVKRILATLEAYAPGIGKMIDGVELLSPLDLEKQFGFTGGDWHHGELSVEQMLFLRPMIGAASYDTPIKGLYLAGAGCHPGGGISGAAGWNAAERILRRECRP